MRELDDAPFPSLHLWPDGLKRRKGLAFFPAVEHFLDQQVLHVRPIVPFGVPAVEGVLQVGGGGFVEPGLAVSPRNSLIISRRSVSIP